MRSGVTLQSGEGIAGESGNEIKPRGLNRENDGIPGMNDDGRIPESELERNPVIRSENTPDGWRDFYRAD